MNKKLHKTGTTILLALAPAAAIGVVGVVIANSIQVDEDVDVSITKEQWLEEYNKKQANLIKNYDSYDIEDVELKINGTKTDILAIDNCILENRSGGKDKQITIQYSNDPGIEAVITTAEIIDEIDECEYQDQISYIKNGSKLKIIIPNGEDKTKNYHTYAFNQYGHLLIEKDVNDGVLDTDFEITYKKSPHDVTNYTLLDDGQLTYSSYVSMYANTQYTFSFTTGSEISQNFSLSVSQVGENCNLNNIDVYINNDKATKDVDWKWDADNNELVFIKKVPNVVYKASFSIEVNIDAAQVNA